MTPTPLTHAEREVVLTIADDEKHWTVFTDSRRAASTRFLKVARALGVEPVRLGYGWEFTLPLRAIKVSAPRTTTDAQREASRRQGALYSRNLSPRTRSPAPSGVGRATRTQGPTPASPGPGAAA